MADLVRIDAGTVVHGRRLMSGEYLLKDNGGLVGPLQGEALRIAQDILGATLDASMNTGGERYERVMNATSILLRVITGPGDENIRDLMCAAGYSL